MRRVIPQRLIPQLVATLLSLLSTLAYGQRLPPGTVLPVMLETTLDARHDRPGKTLTGTIRQDLYLPDGAIVPKGTRVVGHVVKVTSPSPGSGSRLTIRFDEVLLKHRHIPITVHLRALASMNEVFEAKMPTNAIDDYGTSPSDWNTVQVGGAGVYRGSGEVVAADRIVGHSTDYGAVTAKLIAAPAGGCDDGHDGRQQALWVFSPWACGLYGFDDLRIAHAGRTEPVGEIELESGGNIHVTAGSGWLLRVNSAAPGPSAASGGK
ncbi:MAG TPA: TrbI/VirB10 family protein [Candidatus Binatia bacterium]|nr:TrbI/VirB10 family protein [Candidatus Binatia bacterium]